MSNAWLTYMGISDSLMQVTCEPETQKQLLLQFLQPHLDVKILESCSAHYEVVSMHLISSNQIRWDQE